MNEASTTIGSADIAKILKLLPHRYPFLMVDRVVAIDGETKCTGVKSVTMNEYYLQGHFPGHPVMPMFELIATARGAQVNGRDIVEGADASGDAAMWLYALASRVPMGQADRYAVLSAPTVATRLAALSDAVDTVTAMVEFQLSDG